MPSKVDLHIHSYASDGQWSPEEIIEQIDLHQIKIFSVCDHDVVDAIEKLALLTQARKDLTYIKGVEISVIYQNKEHHILTYGIDEKSEGLRAILDENIRIRDDYNDRLIKFLSQRYKQISLED